MMLSFLLWVFAVCTTGAIALVDGYGVGIGTDSDQLFMGSGTQHGIEHASEPASMNMKNLKLPTGTATGDFNFTTLRLSSLRAGETIRESSSGSDSDSDSNAFEDEDASLSPVFTTLAHPRFPAHQVRIKKTEFCDPTVK